MRDEKNAVDLEVDCDRHSQLQLGSYSTAGFRARLARSRAPIEGATDPSFAVFVHEYWHHLQRHDAGRNGTVPRDTGAPSLI